MSDAPKSERAPISTVRSGPGVASSSSDAASAASPVAASAPVSPVASSPRGYATMPTELRLFAKPDSAALTLDDIAAAPAVEKLREAGRGKDVLFDDIREEVPRDPSERAAENRAEHVVVEIPAKASPWAKDAQTARETAALTLDKSALPSATTAGATAEVVPVRDAVPVGLKPAKDPASVHAGAQLARRPGSRSAQDRKRGGVWPAMLVVVPLLLGVVVLARVWGGGAGSGSGAEVAMSATSGGTTSGVTTFIGATSASAPLGTSADTATPGATARPSTSVTGAQPAPRATGEPSVDAGAWPKVTSEPTVAPSVTTAPSVTVPPSVTAPPGVTVAPSGTTPRTSGTTTATARPTATQTVWIKDD